MKYLNLIIITLLFSSCGTNYNITKFDSPRLYYSYLDSINLYKINGEKFGDFYKTINNTKNQTFQVKGRGATFETSSSKYIKLIEFENNEYLIYDDNLELKSDCEKFIFDSLSSSITLSKSNQDIYWARALSFVQKYSKENLTFGKIVKQDDKQIISKHSRGKAGFETSFLVEKHTIENNIIKITFNCYFDKRLEAKGIYYVLKSEYCE